jgi:hypothetical protein
VREEDGLLRRADEEEQSARLLDAREIEEVGRLAELDRVDVLLVGEDDADAVRHLLEHPRAPRGELGLVERRLGESVSRAGETEEE